MADVPAALDAPPQDGVDAAAHEAAMKTLVDALDKRKSVSDIRTIVEGRLREDPDFLKRHDERGWIPLHHAVWKMSEVNVLKYFLEACPESIRIKTRDSQELAIHIELQTLVPNFNAIQLLVGAWTASLYEPSEDGSLPLHLAVLPDLGHNRLFPLPFEIVNFLVQEGPRAVREKGPQGRLPIHCLVLCTTRVELRTVDLLVDPYPETLMVRDDNGAHPVHVVGDTESIEGAWMWMNSTFEDEWMTTESPKVVRHLVSKCPRSVRESGPHDEGGTLLHVALSSWPWATVNDIHYLVAACPDVLQVADRKGNLPVHLAVASSDMGTLQLLAGHRRQTVRVRGHKGRLPAHVAAKTGDLQKVRYLLGLWPGAIRERDDDGQTLLHLAVESERTVQYLLDRLPELVGLADNQGRSALHTAVRCPNPLLTQGKLGAVLAVLRLLVDRRPELVHQADSQGNLVLHTACSGYAPAPVLRFVYEQHPDAIRVRNGAGLLPVQLAMHRERSESLVSEIEYYSRVRSSCLEVEVSTLKFLFKEWPECVTERDPSGKTLLHSAMDGPASPGYRVALALLKKWPEATLVPDDQGFLPVHIGAAADAPLDVLYEMLQVQQRVLREQQQKPPQEPLRSGPSTPKRSRTGKSDDDEQA